MNSHVEMPEKGRSNIFREKQTINKVLLKFLDVEKLSER